MRELLLVSEEMAELMEHWPYTALRIWEIQGRLSELREDVIAK